MLFHKILTTLVLLGHTDSTAGNPELNRGVEYGSGEPTETTEAAGICSKKTLLGRYDLAVTGQGSGFGPGQFYSSGWRYYDGFGRGMAKKFVKSGGVGAPTAFTDWFDYDIEKDSCQGLVVNKIVSIANDLPGFPGPYPLVVNGTGRGSITAAPDGSSTAVTAWDTSIAAEASGTEHRVCGTECEPSELYNIPSVTR